MIYPYRCGACGRYTEVYKSHVEAGNDEKCPDCQNIMSRIWTVPQVHVCPDSYYNTGLGAVVSGSKSINEHISRVYNETGTEIVEVGTGSGKVKPVKRDITFTDAEMHDMHQMISD
jgi:predicted nucleic acid-binding Zn ribbon protein